MVIVDRYELSDYNYITTKVTITEKEFTPDHFQLLGIEYNPAGIEYKQAKQLMIRLNQQSRTCNGSILHYAIPYRFVEQSLPERMRK